ncbi:hypothetical protein [Pseudobdellovibrio exovorus]|uniref:Uncharacterized protein n=1 Tax=Pseudobdellovibrio exovorus JSS TaxID=1184267 RepID=M4V8F3_9BACT|nr:hypothetical protein [Pseudobdellovibrio exovorus]AGH94740.1 hypothetical protein A11Q_520 [Pseudobdellovibrio exovorus JSS]
MNTKSVLLAVGVVVIATTLYFFNKSSKTVDSSQQNVEVEEDAPPAAQADFVAPPETVAQGTAVSPEGVTENREKNNTTAIDAMDSEVTPLTMQKFSQHLQFMTKCLGMESRITPPQQAEPTIENIMDQLRPNLGESQAQVHDWTQTEIVGKDGVRRRVRVDYDYSDETAEPARRLSMYQMNAYGMPEIVQLTPDQMDNPNEAYIHSLIEGNKVVVEESAARVYFANGEEMIFSIRNGNINGLSVTKGLRSFNCQNLDEDRSACSCP